MALVGNAALIFSVSFNIWNIFSLILLHSLEQVSVSHFLERLLSCGYCIPNASPHGRYSILNEGWSVTFNITFAELRVLKTVKWKRVDKIFPNEIILLNNSNSLRNTWKHEDLALLHTGKVKMKEAHEIF